MGRDLIELPAGTIDAGESPDSTAPRELAEETGYRAGRITRIAEWFVSPGVMNERMYLYLCEDLTPGPTDHQPDERMEPLVVPWAEAVAMALDGRIEDAKSRLAILLCDRRRQPPTPRPDPQVEAASVNPSKFILGHRAPISSGSGAGPGSGQGTQDAQDSRTWRDVCLVKSVDGSPRG